MANRFLNNITINDQYTFPSTDGSAGQAIVTDGLGNLTFGSAVASSATSSESVHITVKNTSGATITKGTPVYVTGETGNSGKIEVAPADASDVAKMPALGLLESDIADSAEGFCVQGGLLEGLATATIDGTSTTANDTVYIKAGGGLTMTKPTGTNFIQNIAKVARVHASNGSLVVSSILRTNDVPTPLYIDHDNQRVGIGEENPSDILVVSNGTGEVRFGGSNGRTLSAYDNGSLANFDFYANQTYFNSDFLIAPGKKISTSNGSNDNLYLTTTNASKAIYTDRSVGIGTTSPSATLSVAGTTQLAGEVSLPSTGTATASANYSSQTLKFTTSAWDTNHAAARDVDWNIRNEGSSTIFADGTLTFYEENPSYNHWKLKLPGRGSGASYIHPDAALFNGRVNIYESDTSNINISLHPGGDSYFNGGKVGIGTITPDNKFHVVAGADGEVAQFTGAIENRGLSIRSETNVDASALTVFNSQSGGSKGTFAFETDGSERMRITSDGNVGIGTTSPQEELHITSTVPVIRLEDTDGGYAQIVGSNGSLSLRSDQANTVASSIIDFIIDNSEKMRIDSSGNVGIGTPSPGTKLDVISEGTAIGTTGYYYNARFTDTSNVGVMIGHNNVANGNGMIAGINKLVFLTYGTSWGERMIIDGSGNVGIGTASPNATLDVNGAGNFSGGTVVSGIDTNTNIGVAIAKGDYLYSNDGNYLRRLIGHTPSGNIEVGQDATSLIGDILLRPGAAGNIRFFGSGSEDMRINSSGDVGIGTTSPGYKLDVSGGARAGGVVTYSKTYGSLDTAGNAVAGLTTGGNGNSAGFTFTCFGNTGDYQKIVYSCYNVSGTWYTKKVIDEGTNAFDIEASANAATITFTFKSTSGTKSYTPRVTVEATGSAINSIYA